MALDAGQIAGLNGMCMKAQAAALGTAVSALETSAASLGQRVGTLEGAMVAGSHAVTGAEATAGTLDIDSGIVGCTHAIVQIYRTGVLSNGDAVISVALGVLTVADGASTYSVTEGDVINYILFA